MKSKTYFMMQIDLIRREKFLLQININKWDNNPIQNICKKYVSANKLILFYVSGISMFFYSFVLFLDETICEKSKWIRMNLVP